MRTCLFLLTLLYSFSATGQTSSDLFMVPRRKFEINALYGAGSWRQYWETDKLRNAYFERLHQQQVVFFGSYGLLNRVNLLISLPYVRQEAIGIMLRPEKGWQDLHAGLKLLAIGEPLQPYGFKTFLTTIYQQPLGYYADAQPISIGLGARAFAFRVISGYTTKSGLYASTLAGRIWRSDVYIDRTYYYSERGHYTNRVSMPHMYNIVARIGIDKMRFRIEAAYDLSLTDGGYDLRTDDLMFINNNADAGLVSLQARYYPVLLRGLGVIAQAGSIVHGRNVGKANTYLIGLSFNPVRGQSDLTGTR